MRRIGIDTGGTFTDLVCIDGGEVVIEKQSSTPVAPATAVLDALKSTGGIEQRKDLTYGSTMATNAILERRGARVALIATHGFEDVIFIGRQDRPNLYSLYPRKPEPLVERGMVFGIKERTLATGENKEDISCRFVATMTTMVLVFIFTGKLDLVVKVGALEVIAKLLFYYLHERVWLWIKWGIKAC